MAINPDIRDQAYQFFIEEAPELLHTLETGLLKLAQDHSTMSVHSLMRAAHTLKGGAASVGLEPIATIAHRLETILKAFYGDKLTIDTDLENQLLQAYDCLRLPLMEQITTGSFDAEYALAVAEPIFTHIEERCGAALNQSDAYIPSSAELGVDMVVSIFEVDVAQGIEFLSTVAANPETNEVAGALRAQMEIFGGFAELLNLSEFAAIIAMVQHALEAHPDCALEITQLAINDFKQYRQAVLAGDRTRVIEPSAALLALVEPPAMDIPAIDLLADQLITGVEGRLIDTDNLVDLETPLAIDATANVSDGLVSDGFVSADLTVEAPEFNQAVDLFENNLSEDLDPSQAIDFSLLENIFDKEISVPLVNTEVDLENDPLPLENTTYVGTEAPSEITEAFSDLTLEADSADSVPIADATIEMLAEAIDADYTEYGNYADYVDYAHYAENADNGLLVSGSSSLVPSQHQSIQLRESLDLSYPPDKFDAGPPQREPIVNPNLTVRVDADRLERMNSLVGELSISHNGLFLQTDQLQTIIRELLNRFSRFQTLAGQLQQLSDQMLVAPERSRTGTGFFSKPGNGALDLSNELPLYTSSYLSTAANTIEFDSLEMDTYGSLHFQLQGILEEMVQLEEAVDDVSFFAKQAHQMLHQQRPMLNQLQEEVTWSRMVPIGEVLNRFPRMLRDMSATYHKPVNLNLVGTEVLVDKAILEKLYDPLLHLVRNAFDHGIEPLEVRRQRYKPEQGEIEIRTYHRGNQTVIEVKDDGQGLNLDRIRERIFELGWMSANQLLISSPAQVFEYIFEPGFSTATQVSKLSGRGVGLDVVRSQLQAVKGTVTVESFPGKGTTFTLRLPLMLTIAKLIICNVSSVTIALAVDCVAEILTPKSDQIRQSGSQRFLYWQEQIIPVYRLVDRLDYHCPLPEAEALSSSTLSTVATPSEWAAPMLIFRKEDQVFALEVNQVITEQELVIKPFSPTIAPPSYTYGCTILADGKLVPVIDAVALLSSELVPVQEVIAPHETTTQSNYAFAQLPGHTSPAPFKTVQTSTILVVDDAATLRRSLALSLERVGFRVVQARDGREAIEQLQQRLSIRLIICDIEMPNMNGFEFLNYRRQDPQLFKLPVVILTSRSNEKHRWLAMQLGATAYFTKPYLEQEFLEAIKNLIQ